MKSWGRRASPLPWLLSPPSPLRAAPPSGPSGSRTRSVTGTVPWHCPFVRILIHGALPGFETTRHFCRRPSIICFNFAKPFTWFRRQFGTSYRIHFCVVKNSAEFILFQTYSWYTVEFWQGTSKNYASFCFKNAPNTVNSRVCKEEISVDFFNQDTEVICYQLLG
jgi:hypothetical protein